MKLKELIECPNAIADIEIEGLSFNSDEICKNCLFFCLIGGQVDGHLYAEKAVKNGAVALVVEYRLNIDIPQVVVDNSRIALSLCSSVFYGNPSKRLKVVGITGTNGKTTTTYILKSILEECGYKTGVIGTTAVFIGDNKLEAKLTTPDPIDLHMIFKKMAEEKVDYCIMEVSAHAIDLHKIEGIEFEAVALTNISRDHLDYFKTMERYIECKKKLFDKAYAKFGIINIDDENGRNFAATTNLPILTYGCYNPSDVFAIDLTMSVNGLEYVLNLLDDIAEIKFNLPGKFNMYNTLCAAGIARALEMPIKGIVKGIKNLKNVEGRFNIINTSKCSIIIDFAHTDDGLANILYTIADFAPKQIITVFGCGGNRDKTKRPIMGKIVAHLSNYTIITSDNPRMENPKDIINDIEKGVREIDKENYCCIENRQEAIKFALEKALDGDIILIAGKGAEKYQDIMGVKYPYNDEKYIMELIEEFKL